MRVTYWSCRIVGILALALAAGAARADATADFYSGKTITVMIASGAGDGYDFFGRALAKYIGRFLPGHPNAIVQNMPGAGGTKMANYAYNAAPQDATLIGVPLAPAPRPAETAACQRIRQRQKRVATSSATSSPPTSPRAAMPRW